MSVRVVLKKAVDFHPPIVYAARLSSSSVSGSYGVAAILRHGSVVRRPFIFNPRLKI